MGGDADFEHARLLTIHTSVVVSARSVMGFYGLGTLVHSQRPMHSGVVRLLILLLHKIPYDYTTIYRYSQSIPTVTFDIAREVAAVVYSS